MQAVIFQADVASDNLKVKVIALFDVEYMF